MSERTTPLPEYYAGPGPSIPPPPMLLPEKLAFRTAAVRATKLYPGPLGELAARELLAVEEFGWRLANGDDSSLIARLRDQIDRDWDAGL